MGNGYVLTAKKLQCCIKNGLTPEEVAEKFQLTDDELKERIKQFYKAGDGTKAQVVYGQLEANRKKAHCRKTTSKKDTEKPVEVPEVVEEVAAPVKTDLLSDYLKEEEALSKEVINLEGQHKGLKAKRKVCLDDLRKLQEQARNLKASLQKVKDEYDAIASKADAIAEEMNAVSTHLQPKRAALEEVRQKIESARTIAICVSEDGTIEAPDNPELSLEPDDWESLKTDLANREECLDLRLRDISTLARLLKICEQIEKVSLICDNPELEKAFLAIHQ